MEGNLKEESGMAQIKAKAPELLLPASCLEVLKVAVHYGADAVYIGGNEFGLRAKAKNFSPEEMQEGITFCHERGKKVYVTVNILAHNADMEGVRAYLKELRAWKPDGLIIADPGIFTLAKELCPEIDLHISTQANNTNYETFRFWHQLGAKRVVSARELSLAEIKELRDKIPPELEIETFVHGAMCISYSGRCLLSNYFTGRDANHGECTHPCRWNYTVMEESRPGEYLPVYENERGTFLFNSRDLNMIGYLPELIEAGIDSFKIEGRMKTALYVAIVARTYRNAIEDYLASEERYRNNLPRYEEELCGCTHRPYGTGFFFGKPDASSQIYTESTYEKGATYLGMAGACREDGSFVMEQKNKFCVGETVEILKTDGRNLHAKVKRICAEDGTEMTSAPHAKQILQVTLDQETEPCDVLRRKEEKEKQDG